jgi:hypothetical protein
MADFAVTVGENVVEPENVALKKLPKMFRRFRQIVDFEKFADEADVGSPGEFHFFRTVMEVEFRRKRFFESLRSGVARVDERAVNIEQNEPNHAARKLIAEARGDNAVRARKNLFRAAIFP